MRLSGLTGLCVLLLACQAVVACNDDNDALMDGSGGKGTGTAGKPSHGGATSAGSSSKAGESGADSAAGESNGGAAPDPGGLGGAGGAGGTDAAGGASGAETGMGGMPQCATNAD